VVDVQIILDNTVVSNFAQANLLHMLFSMWNGQIATTTDVFLEYQAGVRVGKLPATGEIQFLMVDLTEQERRFCASLSTRLGAGEASCLAVAYYRKVILATDDLFARKITAQFHILKVGTVGILVEAVRKNKLSLVQAQASLEMMIEQGYWSPIRSLVELL
jgi:predicted nucleic acid-binding protein